MRHPFGIGSVLVCTLALCAALSQPSSALGAGAIVISQVYGGGGNTNAPLQADFVELFNRGDAPVTMNGWSLQYASSTGSGWANFSSPLALPTATINPGKYFLIKLDVGVGCSGVPCGTPLPTPDYDSGSPTIAMATGSGKIALVNTTVPLVGVNPVGHASIVDFVGYGSVNAFEGSGPSLAQGNLLAGFRKNGGCTDTNNNANDFDAPATPAPRNSATPAFDCTGAAAVGASIPSTVYAGGPVLLQVTVTGGVPPYTVTATDLSSIGGGTNVAFTETEPGSGIFTYTQVVPCNGIVFGDKVLAISVQDSRAGTPNIVSANINLSVESGAVTFGADGTPADSGMPANASRVAGETAKFSVIATGGAPLTYQWVNGSGTPLVDGGKISGATTSKLEIADVQAAEAAAGPYRVTVTGACDSKQSDAATLTIVPEPTAAQKKVLISQVYGGGGNSGATYKNDFIELYNSGNTAVTLTNWSVQYASANGSAQESFDRPPRVTTFSATIPAGHYYLIQEAAGTSCDGQPCGSDFGVTADATGSIQLASGSGKVALVSAPDPLTDQCGYSASGNPTALTVVDFVGYGTAPGCYEGTAAAPAPSGNAQAILRTNPCSETNDNAADFVTGPSNPRSSASPVNAGIAQQPADRVFCPGKTATFAARADGACIVYQWQVDTGSGFVDATTGSGQNSAAYTTPLLDAGDVNNRYRVVATSASTGTSATSNSAGFSDAEKQVLISQVYARGGNTGGTPATYNADFVELYNKGTSAVDLTGWSLQYASATGISWTSKVDLTSISLLPGQFYLIGLSAGTAGVTLPVPDVSANFGLGSDGGKIALVDNTTVLAGVCPSDCSIIDFVGFGNANCSEPNPPGTSPAAAPTAGDNTAAMVRTSVCIDTDNNLNDFIAAPAAPRNRSTTGGSADFTGDGKVNLADFDIFRTCAATPELAAVPYNPAALPAGCTQPVICGRIPPDINKDGIIDMNDFGLFQRCYSGTLDADPNCAN